MPLKSFGKPTSRSLSHNGTVHPDRPAHSSNRQNQSVDISFSTVDIAPNRAVTGGACVEGVPRSMLRNVAEKLTFVPAGNHYREWYEPRTQTSVTYFYFDPAALQIDSNESLVDILFARRLFFEDATIQNTAAKLRQTIDAPGGASQLYVEALGVVLIHELVRLNRGTSRGNAAVGDGLVRGGLAAWQQQIVTACIEEHLSEQIPLATLARPARLSPFHFCRAFKQSFSVPPHRYHTNRRIEQAKVMLAEPNHSVTEVGLTVGFSETNSFTAAFRKITGRPRAAIIARSDENQTPCQVAGKRSS